MAKKKKTARKLFTRARASVKSFSKRRKSSSSTGITNVLMYGAGYGAVRPYIAQAIAPVSSMLPAGNYNDEVAMGIINYFASKGTFGQGFIKEMGKAGLYVEAAQLGSDVATGKFTSNFSGKISTASTNTF